MSEGKQRKITFSMKSAGIVAAPIAMLMLSACASNFNANVSRFQSQLPPPQGQSFFVVAEDPKDQGSLEFAQYAQLVDNQLTKQGYTEAASPETADLIVHFDYGVDEGKLRNPPGSQFNDPFYSPWYGYSPYGYSPWGYTPRIHPGRWGYGWYDPFFWNSNELNQPITVYNSNIDLKIDRKADNKRLFEGKAEAASRSNRLTYLVPNLVEAMFTNFPGNSGETVRISVAPEKTASAK